MNRITESIQVMTSSKMIREKRYVFDFIFRVLGVSWELVEIESDSKTYIYFNKKCAFQCTNDFWIRADREWLKESLIPTDFEKFTVPREYGLGENFLPVFFGNNISNMDFDAGIYEFGFDLFGTIFFVLTCYEERVQKFDGERFPFKKSILYKFNFIERPLVDEYIWVLGAILRRAGIYFTAPVKNPVIQVSCDVDNPFAKNMRFGDVLKNGISSYRRAGDFGDFFGLIKSYTSHNFMSDIYIKGILKIMEVNEKVGDPAVFNFIPYPTSVLKDGRSILHEEWFGSLVRIILNRGHKIGIHPGFYSFSSSEFMMSSFDAFRRFFGKYMEGDLQLTGRQHYLNWIYSKTDRLLCENKLYEDSTLGFAESIGFRCGTSHRFKIYDYDLRRELDLYEQPLIVMEDTLISKRYMGLGYSDEAYNRVRSCFDKCKKFNGKMTLLWHNCHLGTKTDIDFYFSLVNLKSS